MRGWLINSAIVWFCRLDWQLIILARIETGDASEPQPASNHGLILSSRLPEPLSGTAILIRTGNRRSAS
jgi:hypothetical protein